MNNFDWERCLDERRPMKRSKGTRIASLANGRQVAVADYDLLAPQYESLFGDEARATWRGGLLRLTTLRPLGARVLDLGAGTGIGGRLLRAFRPSQLVGLDASAEMLAVADDTYDSVVVGDIERLPFGSDAFDVCVAGFDTINHLSLRRLTETLSETNLGRVTSQLAFDCFTRESEDALLAGALSHRLARLEPGVLSSAHSVGDREVNLHHFLPTARELHVCLKSTGWRVLEAVDVRIGGREVVPGHYALSLKRV